MAKTIDLEPIEREEVSPRRFVDLYTEEADNIESVRIVPPRLGSKGLGTLVVKWKQPLYASRLAKSRSKKGSRIRRRQLTRLLSSRG